MVDTPSPLLRLRLQEKGTNVNIWGEFLNGLFQMLEQSAHGVVAITVSGPVTLTSINYVEDQARKKVLLLTGTGGAVTIPGVAHVYLVRNACSGVVTFTNGGVTASVQPGQAQFVFTDGTDCWSPNHLPLAGGTMTGPLILHANPTLNLQATTKQYVDGLAFQAVDLPGQGGQNGKYITTDGSSSRWDWVAFSSITGLPTDLAGYGITDAASLTDLDDLQNWTIGELSLRDAALVATSARISRIDGAAPAIEVLWRMRHGF